MVYKVWLLPFSVLSHLLTFPPFILSYSPTLLPTFSVFLSLTVSLPQASQPDELTIDEQEMLEVIEDGDMEDWVKVPNRSQVL